MVNNQSELEFENKRLEQTISLAEEQLEKEEPAGKKKPEKAAPAGKQAEGETFAAKAKGFLFKEPDPESYLIRLFGRLGEDQMEEVLDGYEKGLPVREIKKYAKKEYTARKMQEIKKLLLKKHGLKITE